MHLSTDIYTQSEMKMNNPKGFFHVFVSRWLWKAVKLRLGFEASFWKIFLLHRCSPSSLRLRVRTLNSTLNSKLNVLTFDPTLVSRVPLTFKNRTATVTALSRHLFKASLFQFWNFHFVESIPVTGIVCLTPGYSYAVVRLSFKMSCNCDSGTRDFLIPSHAAFSRNFFTPSWFHHIRTFQQK